MEPCHDVALPCMPDEIKRQLNALNYVVLKIEPTIWRVRGKGDEEDWKGKGKYIDVWALHGLYRMYYESGKAKPYTDLIDLVQAKLEPYPSMRTPEQEEAYIDWRERLDFVLHRFFLAVK